MSHEATMPIEEARALCAYVRVWRNETPRQFLAALEAAWAPDSRNVSPRPNISTSLIDRMQALPPHELAGVLNAADYFRRIYPRYEDDEVRALQRVGLLRATPLDW